MTAEAATVGARPSRGADGGSSGEATEHTDRRPPAASRARGERRFFIVEEGGQDSPSSPDAGGGRGLPPGAPLLVGESVRQLRAGSGGRRGHTLAAALRRVLDVAVSSLLLVLLAPLMAVIAAAIRLDSSGPILYRQTRVGRSRRKGGRSAGGGAGDRDRGGFEDALATFTLYKFRSMYADAEEGTGAVWAREEDERITAVGRWLRRLHLDEIPQLWNVLRGDMALVGPRPERPEFVRDLAEEVPQYTHRLLVRPGLTGLAQVSQESDRSVEDVSRKITYDLEYLRRRSLWLDLRILLRTPFVVLARTLQESPDLAGWIEEGRRATPRPPRPTGTT